MFTNCHGKLIILIVPLANIVIRIDIDSSKISESAPRIRLHNLRKLITITKPYLRKHVSNIEYGDGSVVLVQNSATLGSVILISSKICRNSGIR